MKNVLVGIGLVALFAAVPLDAAVAECRQLATLQALIDASGEGRGCYIEDLVFNNFTYTGGGLVTAGDVAASALFQSGRYEDTQSWLFFPTQASGWIASFTLSYDVIVCVTESQGCLEPEPASAIYVSDDVSISPPLLPVNGTTITDTQTAGSKLLGTIVLTGTSPMGQLVYSAQTMIHTSTVSSIAPGYAIRSYQQDFVEIAPEPATYLMAAGGWVLLALGLRRLKKN